jgi:hypothetical protein
MRHFAMPEDEENYGIYVKSGAPTPQEDGKIRGGGGAERKIPLSSPCVWGQLGLRVEATLAGLRRTQHAP